MKRMIKQIHNKAVKRFKNYLDEKTERNETLCGLEAANFKSSFPKYEDEVHASLYLMRYASAYLAEYYLAYKHLFEKNFLDAQKISILSLGSGTSIDGISARCALRELNPDVEFSYLGIDKVNWPGKPKLSAEFKFMRGDISRFDPESLVIRAPYNIIILPRILSEVSAETISVFIRNLPVQFLEDNIALIISKRSAQNQVEAEKDTKKMEKVLKEIKFHGDYWTHDEIHIKSTDAEYNNKYIYDLPDLPGMGFFIDEEVINLARDPGKFCCRKDDCNEREILIDNHGYASCKCINKIGRYPITTTSYFDSHIYLLEKCPIQF